MEAHKGSGGIASVTLKLGSRWRCMYVYRVFHDLWTLLQDMISQVFVIKKVHINMCSILDGYGVMTVWNVE